MISLLLVPSLVRSFTCETDCRFLRSSLCVLCRGQDVSERPGASMKVGKDARSMALSIGSGTGVVVGHPKAQSVVKQDSDLPGRRCHRFLLSDP